MIDNKFTMLAVFWFFIFLFQEIFAIAFSWRFLQSDFIYVLILKLLLLSFELFAILVKGHTGFKLFIMNGTAQVRVIEIAGYCFVLFKIWTDHDFFPYGMFPPR